MLEELKEKVYKANIKLKEYSLIVLTWGNASAISDDRKYVVIKPSGVDYAEMTADMMVVCDIDGNVIEGELNPSSDLPTHLELYRNFPNVKSVVHTHSRWATAFAQSEQSISCYGTTHADNFYGTIPCTRQLSEKEIEKDYELNTGKVIVETFNQLGIEPDSVPAVLVSKHGPFTWGPSAEKAVENALILDECAYMAYIGKTLTNGQIAPAPQELQDKHYFRKHGKNAYYGQGKKG